MNIHVARNKGNQTEPSSKRPLLRAAQVVGGVALAGTALMSGVTAAHATSSGPSHYGSCYVDNYFVHIGGVGYGPAFHNNCPGNYTVSYQIKHNGQDIYDSPRYAANGVIPTAYVPVTRGDNYQGVETFYIGNTVVDWASTGDPQVLA